MNRLSKHLLAITIALTTTAAFSIPPKQLITHNHTDFESNAYVAGTIPSQHPTRAHSDTNVFWTSVRMACFGHILNGKCPALIKMETNTNHPVDIGTVSLDVNTGEITPSQLSANGYTITVNGLGETTLTKQ